MNSQLKKLEVLSGLSSKTQTGEQQCWERLKLCKDRNFIILEDKDQRMDDI